MDPPNISGSSEYESLGSTAGQPDKHMETLRAHLELLLRDDGEGGEAEEVSRNAPIFTAHVLDEDARASEYGSGSASESESASQSQDSAPAATFTQYGLLAGDINRDPADTSDPRIFYNVASPSSVFICGSQGSGKSHSLSCLLENALLPSRANVLPSPLTGIVFHYDTFISDTGGAACEAAYISSSEHVSVRVLCAPTNTRQIKRIYSHLPNVTVEELRLNETDLDTRKMFNLMAVNDSSDGLPLYLHVVMRILRELRIEQQQNGTTFNYGKFKRQVDAEALKTAQLGPLQQRLDTLESFMNQKHAKSYDLFAPRPGSTTRKKAPKASGNSWTPKAGQLTVVDLSCPCVTPDMACSLFDICLSLFLEQTSEIGRVVALDEAHKYMTDGAECQALTESLLSTIRLQRHLGTRVIISTQEPSISPRLLDLCSVTIVHRFTSPDWLMTLSNHLAGASAWSPTAGDEGGGSQDARVRPLALDRAGNINAQLFDHIVRLNPGEALLFSPTAVIGDAVGPDGHVETVRLGRGVLKVRIRRRVTADGGSSVMAGA